MRKVFLAFASFAALAVISASSAEAFPVRGFGRVGVGRVGFVGRPAVRVGAPFVGRGFVAAPAVRFGVPYGAYAAPVAVGVPVYSAPAYTPVFVQDPVTGLLIQVR